MASGSDLTGLLDGIEGIITEVRAHIEPVFTGTFAVLNGLARGTAVPARDTALTVFVLTLIAILAVTKSLNPRRRTRKSLGKQEREPGDPWEGIAGLPQTRTPKKAGNRP